MKVIPPGIPCHTIPGECSRGDSPESSGGENPNWSSHLAGCMTDRLVPTHHAAYQTSQAVGVVARIPK